MMQAVIGPIKHDQMFNCGFINRNTAICATTFEYDIFDPGPIRLRFTAAGVEASLRIHFADLGKKRADGRVGGV